MTALRLHSTAPALLCPVFWHEPALVTTGRCSGGGLPAGVQPVSCWAQEWVTHGSGLVATGTAAGSEMSAQHRSVVDPLTPCSPAQSPDSPGDLESHSKKTTGHAGDSLLQSPAWVPSSHRTEVASQSCGHHTLRAARTSPCPSHCPVVTSAGHPLPWSLLCPMLSPTHPPKTLY